MLMLAPHLAELVGGFATYRARRELVLRLSAYQQWLHVGTRSQELSREQGLLSREQVSGFIVASEPQIVSENGSATRYRLRRTNGAPAKPVRAISRNVRKSPVVPVPEPFAGANESVL
jgi:hypothetical protein